MPKAGRHVCSSATRLPADWNPDADTHLTDWECAQHLARVLESPQGGIEAAARLYSAMGPERSEAARMLAYRLYDICERKGHAAEAQVWNMLAQEWPALESALTRLAEDARQRKETAGSRELRVRGEGSTGWCVGEFESREAAC